MATKGKHAKKSNINNKKLVIIIAAAVAAILAIVLLITLLVPKGEEQEEDSTPQDIIEENNEPDIPEENTVEPEPVVDEPEQEPEQDPEPEIYTGPVNPLTGLPVEEDISANRPFAVMLNNLKVAVPQAGVGSADILYETLAEGGITRFMGVYQDISVVDTIGSVRSSRPYFLDLAQGLDAIYIHAGGSDDAYTQIKARGVTNIDGVNGSGETFYRDSWRKSNMGYEHSLMLDTTLIPDYITKHKLRSTHEDGYTCNMVFSDDAAPVGKSAENIKVTFSSSKTTSFAYSSDEGLYTLSQYGTTMTDSLDGSEVKVKNVIVLYASISQIPGDSAGRLKMTLTGSGSGYFACDGSYTAINWTKDSYTSQFEFTLADGTPIEFGRGSSYIGIIPTSGGKVDFS